MCTERRKRKNALASRALYKLKKYICRSKALINEWSYVHVRTYICDVKLHFPLVELGRFTMDSGEQSIMWTTSCCCGGQWWPLYLGSYKEWEVSDHLMLTWLSSCAYIYVPIYIKSLLLHTCTCIWTYMYVSVYTCGVDIFHWHELGLDSESLSLVSRESTYVNVAHISFHSWCSLIG